MVTSMRFLLAVEILLLGSRIRSTRIQDVTSKYLEWIHMWIRDSYMYQESNPLGYSILQVSILNGKHMWIRALLLV